MRVIAIANQKGGCGKTTTSINFAACLAHSQKKVLLIDLDPQGHSTCGLGISAEKLPTSLYDLLKSFDPSQNEINRTLCDIQPLFSLLPSYVVLGQLEEEWAQLPASDKHFKLKKLINLISEGEWRYDYVIIDCPPNLGALTLNALYAADEVVVPIEPSFFSLHGLAKISETLQKVNQKRFQPIEAHALLTLFDSRTCFSREVYEEVKKYFDQRLFKTIIHESVALKEAASAGQSIVQYAPESVAFQDYWNLATEYLEYEWNRKFPLKDLGWRNVIRQYYGPKQVLGGVLFQVNNAQARGIEIAGDFNHWVPEPLIRLHQDHLWQIILPIEKGAYRYKYIVDGEWQLDAFQPQQRENAYGSLDSYLELV